MIKKIMNTIKAFSVPHVGESYRSSNDRFSFSTEPGREYFCISDGAGSSFNSTLFAELITEYPIIGTQTSFNEKDIEIIQKDWDKKIKEKIESKLFSTKIEDLYKLGKEAGATFVRMCFFEENGKKMWKATAMGDSVMIFIPCDNEIPQYVVSTIQDFKDCQYLKNYVFNTTPDGLLSRSRCKLTKQISIEDEIKEGTFVFMTDALAAWILENHEYTKVRLKELLKISSHEQFQQFISSIRDEVDITDEQSSISKKMGIRSEIVNDDTTLMIVTIADAKNLEFTKNSICYTNIKDLINKEIDFAISKINSDLDNNYQINKEFENKKRELEKKAQSFLNEEKFNIENTNDLYLYLKELKDLYVFQENNTESYSEQKNKFIEIIKSTSNLLTEIDACEKYISILKAIQNEDNETSKKLSNISCNNCSYILKNPVIVKKSINAISIIIDSLFNINNELNSFVVPKNMEEKIEKLNHKIKWLEYQKYSKSDFQCSEGTNIKDIEPYKQKKTEFC